MRARLDRIVKLGAVGCCLGLLLAVQTKAQETVAITCTPTACNPAGGAFATQSTSANPPTFTVSNTNGSKCGTGDNCEAYLAILVPNGTLPAGFTVNGAGAVGTGTFTSASSNLFAALGENGGQDNTFSPWQTTSAAAGSSITPAGSFTVYDFLLGTFIGSANNGQNQEPSFMITLSGMVPVGTGFGAFYEDVTMGDTIVNNSKLSDSLVVVPEPGTMALFGTGLLLLGGTVRRRWTKQV